MVSPDGLDRRERSLLTSFNPRLRITPEVRQRAEDLRQRAIELLDTQGNPYYSFFKLDEEAPQVLLTKADQMTREYDATWQARMKRNPLVGWIIGSLGIEEITSLRRTAEDYKLALECICNLPYRVVELEVSGMLLSIASVHPAFETTAKLMINQAFSSHEIDERTKQVAKLTSLNQAVIRVRSSRWRVDEILDRPFISLLPPEDYDDPTTPIIPIYPVDRPVRRLNQVETVINILSSAFHDS